MGLDINSVIIKDKHYSKDFQKKPEYANGWKSVLKQYYGTKTPVTCECYGKGGKRLAIKYYSVTDTYGLSKYANSGAQHDNACQYYAPDPEKCGLACYVDGVLKELDHGNIGINLGIGLTAKEPVEQTSGNQPTQISAVTRKTQTAISLLGLLHWLWEDSSLNYWCAGFSGKRNWGTASGRLNQSSKKLRSGRKHVSDHLIIAGINSQLQIEKSIKQNNRLILIAQIESRDDFKIVCRDYYGPFINVKKETWDSRISKYPNEAKWLGQEKSDRKGHVILIALTEPPKDPKNGKNYKVIEIVNYALMLVTEEFIPVASSYEYRLADKLVESGCKFVKPLRYDATESIYFPDFVLEDVGDKDLPMEVFGMATREYLAQKKLKTDWYNKEYGINSWWNWDAVNNAEIPALPTAT